MEIQNSSTGNSAGGALSHVYSFHTLMNEKDIMLAYCGEFSQELNKTLLAFTERKFISENVEDTTRRKIFNIMVEMLQNMSKNRIEKSGNSQVTNSVFIIGADENNYLLISSNPIKNDRIEPLRGRLDQVNSLDREGLKQLYKDVRLNASFSDKAGAGIGIIDIARKSENKLEYRFEKADAECSVFSLLIRVTKEKI